MAPIYVREQGAVVRRQGERVLVTLDKAQLLDLPLLHVDQLVLFGNVQITSQAVAMLLKAEVDVVFLSQQGKFRGRLMHTGSKFAQLRHAQLQKMSREPIILSIARQVVRGKLHNQRELLNRRLADSANPLRLQQAANSIDQMLKQAGQANSIDSVRGYEGKAGADYWGAFRSFLPGEFGFQGRKYYPPPDPINSLLSFGYSLLLKDVTAAVQLVGLDPYLGFFHTIDYGRPSLALDMMEEFRPILVDWLVLDLVKQGQMTPADFEQTGQANQPVRLKGPLIDHFIEAYERRAQERVHHVDAGGQTQRRRVIELQVRRLARLMLDQAGSYEPFLMKA